MAVEQPQTITIDDAEQQLAIFQTARTTYARALSDELPKRKRRTEHTAIHFYGGHWACPGWLVPIIS